MIVSLLVRVPVDLTEPEPPLSAAQTLAEVIEIGLKTCEGIVPWHSVTLDEESGIITIGAR